MTTPLAHVAGVPVEELAPVALPLLMIMASRLRESLRARGRRARPPAGLDSSADGGENHPVGVSSAVGPSPAP